jgi:hypothetical protein
VLTKINKELLDDEYYVPVLKDEMLEESYSFQMVWELDDILIQQYSNNIYETLRQIYVY